MDAIKEAMIRHDDGLSANANTPRMSYSDPAYDDIDAGKGREEFLTRRLAERGEELERLREALSECAADFISPETTVLGGASLLGTEFMRRMMIAHEALNK